MGEQISFQDAGGKRISISIVFLRPLRAATVIIPWLTSRQ
jgi:hypothetical protein